MTEPKRKPGRPPAGKSPGVSITLRLDPETWDRARLIGAGNATAGIRMAVAKYRLQAPIKGADGRP